MLNVSQFHDLKLRKQEFYSPFSQKNNYYYCTVCYVKAEQSHLPWQKKHQCEPACYNLIDLLVIFSDKSYKQK